MNQYPTIWITGACGFTGKHLISYIRKAGYLVHIIAIGRSEECASNVDEYVKIDLTNSSALLELAKKSPPKWVFHLAGILPSGAEAMLWHSNVGGTYNLINSLYQAGCKDVRILSVGSAAEYVSNATGFYTENSQVGGISSYGHSKAAQSMLALSAGKNANIDIIIARTFNLVGPGLPRNFVVGAICAQLVDGKKSLTLGNVEAKRDFVDIRDVVKAYWNLLESAKADQVYNVCSGRPTSIKEVVDIAAKIVNLEAEIDIDYTLFRTGDFDCSYGNPEKIKKEVGWVTETSIESSIKDMIDELINRKRLK